MVYGMTQVLRRLLPRLSLPAQGAGGAAEPLPGGVSAPERGRAPRHEPQQARADYGPQPADAGRPPRR